MCARQRFRLEQVGMTTFIHYFASLRARMWTYVNNMVCHFDHIRVMLHHDDRGALVSEFLQQLVHAMHIAWMQPHTRLIENIDHIGQAAAQMLDDFYTLRLATRQCIRFTAEAEVFQANIYKIL